jgi:hypothetical protein
MPYPKSEIQQVAREVTISVGNNVERFFLEASLLPQKEKSFVMIALKHLLEEESSTLPVVSGVVIERTYSSGGKYNLTAHFEGYDVEDPALATAFLFEVVPKTVIELLQANLTELRELVMWHAHIITPSEDTHMQSQDYDDDYEDTADETEEDRATIFRPESEVKLLLELLKESGNYGFSSDIDGYLATFIKTIAISAKKANQA